MTAKKTTRKAPAKKAPTKKAPAKKAADAAAEAPEQVTRMIVVEPQPNGRHAVRPVGVDVLSIPTMLRLAAKEVEESLGV